MRRILSVLFVVAALGGGAVLLFPEWISAPADPPYRFAAVERGPIVAVVNATGKINPTTAVIVGSQLSGQVVEIKADYNSEVEAGQVIARLNSDQIRARLDAARADLQQMQAAKRVQEAQGKRVLADIERAKATEAEAAAQVTRHEVLLAEAERSLGRHEELRKRGVTTDVAFQTARSERDAQRASLESARATLASAKAAATGLQADLQVAGAQVEAAAAQVLQREAAVRQIEADLRNTEIRSPVSGIVVERNVDLGATVAASLQAPTLFLIADDLRRMEVAANIDETDVGRIRAGQRVSFTVNAYPGREFEGLVRQVRLGAQEVQNVMIYTAIISVDNPRQELMPGMTANLQIETDRRDDVLRAPNAALRWRPPAASPERPQRSPGPGPAMAREVGASSPDAGRRGRGREGGERGGQALSALAEAIRAELDLSPEQQTEVDAAFEEMRQSFAGEARGGAGRREAAQAARARLAERIAAILSPEQQEKFEALRTRVAEGRGGTQSGQVFVLGADGRPQGLTVRLGVTDGATTEISGRGIEPGAQLIVGGGPRPAEAAGQPQQQRGGRGPRFGF